VKSNLEYRVYRLEFETPIRFGSGKGASGLDKSDMTMSSDAFFSAVCIEWLNLYGLESMQTMIANVESDQLRISSLLPWQQTVGNGSQFELYLPRPLLGGQIPSSNRSN